MDITGMFGAIFGFTFVVIILMTALILGVIVWGIRRVIPTGDPAEQELRARLARGEIDMAEFEARLDTLRQREKA